MFYRIIVNIFNVTDLYTIDDKNDKCCVMCILL